ncbi:hypothetical protein [Streptomyces sp. NPDC058653]|uniref:hypothetical protein n=1 Tax=Streptomyces sp. NPDC058653 TaxID=3346576 RepID=UPI003649C07E
MSETSSGPGTGTAPVTTEPVADIQLQLLVRLLGENPRTSLPLTLCLPSGVVQGSLIAHEAWKADWAQSLPPSDGPGTRLLSAFPESVDQAVDEMTPGDGPQSLPQWIHLRDATITVGSPQPISVSLWRGRLADICGWSLGKSG